jgi:hypothetical protein
MSKLYNCLPSQLLGIEDDYTAFCFNEACSEIQIRLQNEEKPNYIENRKADEPKQYNNFKDFYKQYGGRM